VARAEGLLVGLFLYVLIAAVSLRRQGWRHDRRADVATIVAAPITLDEVRAASRQNLDALKAEIALRQSAAGVTIAKSFIFPQLLVQAQAQGYAMGPSACTRLFPSSQGRPSPTTSSRSTCPPRPART